MSALPAMQQQRKQKLVATLGNRLEEPPAPAAPTTLPPIDDARFAVAPTPDPAAPPATPAPAPAPPTPAAPPAPPAKSAAEIQAELNEQRWNTLQGMFDAQKRELEEIKARNAELEARLERPAPPATPAPSAPSPLALLPDPEDPALKFTDDEIRDYEQSFPVISKLSKKHSAELVRTVLAPLVEEVQKLKQAQTESGQRVDRADETAFMGQVRAMIPEFDASVVHPKWKGFVAERVPYSSMTIGQALIAAHNGRDLERVKEIFGKFRELHTSTPTEIPSAFAAPPASGASPTPQSTTKPKLKWSERVKVHEDFTKGRVSREEVSRIDKMYKEADLEGRVDYNA